MKNLFVFMLLMMAGVVAEAQISIQIPGLVRSKRVPSLPATTANLTTVAIPAPRGGGSTQLTVWVITRNQDRYSNAIQDAANRGRAFKNGTVRIGSTNHSLAQVLISNYSIAANTGGSTETFYLQFADL
ncbi:MAG: hypothetical protein HKN87_18915 [Saprospiraceae bacterium]|nr:hypothetical protein [Saprospiraceae bacterium]